jgi:hypothetical protein
MTLYECVHCVSFALVLTVSFLSARRRILWALKVRRSASAKSRKAPIRAVAPLPVVEADVVRIRPRLRVRARRSTGRPVQLLIPPERAETASQTDDNGIEVSTATAGDECVVCLENKREVAFVACGHLCVCADCAPWVNACPLCRAPGEKWVKIYGSL